MVRWRKALGDRKFLPAWAALAVLLAAGGWALSTAAERARAAGEGLAARRRLLATFDAASAPEVAALPEDFLTPAPVTPYAAALARAGLSVSSVSEGTRTGPAGRFRTLRLTGTGSFPQILRAFDIIGENNEWNRVDISSLKRTPGGYAFEMEVSTFQGKS